MTTSKKYVIESKGFNYASKSLLSKKEELNKMIEEMAVKYNMTIEDVKKELSK